MRTTAIVLCGVLAHAHAEDVSQLRARGEQLAKEGRFSEAIDAFKAADRIEPRADHACLIALAYTRRELWPQAEIFISKCHQRVRPDDPGPDWLATAENEINMRLATAKAAPITIVTEPEVDAKLTVSSFAPDESFEPRTIHLPFGHHVIFAQAPGFQPAQHELDVRNAKAQRVVIQLHPVGEPVVEPPTPTPVVERDPWPRRMLIAGGVTLAAAVVLNATLYLHYRNELESQMTIDDYHKHETRYDITRGVMFGLYGLGSVAVVTGALLHYVNRDREPAVVVAPIRGGGFAALEWRL